MVVKDFIYVERTSNWKLHLHCVSKMLNFFAATGHSNYAKCARFYLQEMKELPNTHPWLYAKFINVMHHVKRSNKHCNGLSTDLAIEQSLMRSVKSRGGLSQGREYGEGVHHLWALSASICAQVHVYDALMKLTGTSFHTSEQHVELGENRKSIEFNDCKKFLAWFTNRNPFQV